MKVKSLSIMAVAILFQPSLLLAQQAIDVQSRIDFSSESLLAFLDSPELKLVLGLIVGISAAIWLFYILSSVQMGTARSEFQRAERAPSDSPIPPDILSRVAFFGRSSMGMMAQVVPASQEEEDQKKDRTESSEKIQRGK